MLFDESSERAKDNLRLQPHRSRFRLRANRE